MYSKAFEKIFDGKSKPKIEEFPLENGVTKTINNGMGIVEFSKEEVIDGLEFDFHLTKRNKDKDWNLGFGTSHGMLITNKGLATYKHIIENVVVLINTARKHEEVNKITFFGASEDLRIDEVGEFKNFLKTKTDEGAYIFNNFSYIKQIDDWKRSLRIKDGQVFVEESGKRPLSITEKILGEDNKWERSDTFSIKSFIDNNFEMKELLNDKEALSALMKHIGADFVFDRNVDRKDTGKLRTDLYERTLKRSFPDYKFERKGSGITLFL